LVTQALDAAIEHLRADHPELFAAIVTAHDLPLPSDRSR
jgi:hypothetical protein